MNTVLRAASFGKRRNHALRKLFFVAAISAVVVLGTLLAFGQGIVTGSISGTVMDQQGAVVRNAKITATNVATNAQVTTVSNDVGYFSFRSMPVGSYNVAIDAPDFNKYQATGVVVSVAKDTVLPEIKLGVGNTETVAVTGEFPLIESSTSQLTTVFEERKVKELPLGNGFDQLANFVPGVVSPGSVGFGNNNGAQIIANGQRSRSNNFQIDGQANNDNSVTGPSLGIANPDSIQEFQVITNFTAEYGRNSGAQINLITKSGTNQLHGTASYNNRSHTFDSLTKQEKIAGLTRPPRDIQNLYGGSLGGPLYRDKMWFFGSTYWVKVRQGEGVFNAATNQLTPTLNGLSQLAAAFPGNPGVAVLQAIGPATHKLGTVKFNNLRTLLVTNGSGPRVPIEFGEMERDVASPSDQQQHLGRFDWQLSNKDRIFMRYLYDNTSFGAASSLGNGFLAGYVADVPAITHQAGIDWTRQLSPTFVNQARLSYLRSSVDFTGGSLGCTPQTLNQCATNIIFGTSQNALTSTGTLSSFTQVNVGPSPTAPQNRLINNTQYQDNATLIHNRFTFKFGGEYDRQRSPSIFLANANGAYVFTRTGTPLTGGFSSFDNFLRNAPASFALTDGPSKFNFKEQDSALYLQTDWRARDNITLNLGLRWEYSTPAFNLLHDLGVKQQMGPNPFWDPSLPLSRTTVPKVQSDYNNFAPSIGFAYTPRAFQRFLGQDQTVIRGGFRIAYDSIYYNPFLNTAGAAPVVNAGQLNAGGNPAPPGLPTGSFTGAAVRSQFLNRIPAGVGQDPGFRVFTAIDPNLVQPYVEEYTLGVEHQVNNKVAFEVRYVGNHGVKLLRSVNGNPALGSLTRAGLTNLIPAGLQPCSNSTGGLNGAAPPGFGSQGFVDCFHQNVFLRNNGASSSYNGIQSRFDLRNFHNFTGTFNYTFSKTIDTASDVFNVAAAGALAIGPNPFDQSRTEHGLAAFDSPHAFSAIAIYDVPFFRSQQGILGHALGGWQSSLTYRYQTGVPWTPLQDKQTNGAVGNLCDPTNLLSTATDSCRPFVGNMHAPFTSVGQVVSSGGQLQLVDAATGNPTTVSGVRYIINDLNASRFLGRTPFQGVARNTERSDYVSTVNMSVFKNSKITERINLQLQTMVYNLMNRQFLGTPGVFITRPNFGNWGAKDNGGGPTGTSASSLVTGVGRRRMEFGLKVIF